MQNKNNIFDIISCEKKDFLIWKWCSGDKRDTCLSTESIIKFGSILRIREDQAAVFINSSITETSVDYVDGPFEGEVVTQNLPVITGIMKKLYGGATPFLTEVYFINLSKDIIAQFSIPYFKMTDYANEDISASVAVRGRLMYSIQDYRAFLNIHGLKNLDKLSFADKIRKTIGNRFKNLLYELTDKYQISLMKLEQKGDLLGNLFMEYLSKYIEDTLGIIISNIDIYAIEIM